jgi:hypothetical protein
MANGQPFEYVLNGAPISTDHTEPGLSSIRVKEINFSYSVDKVFADIPSLHHVNDGLIYTCVNAPYSPGTDQNMCVFLLYLKCMFPSR